MSHVCPWWFAYTFDNPLRRLFHDPGRILTPYVREGMRVADVGCGLGYFSLALARLVKEKGKVFAVDIQPQMLKGLLRRADRAGLSSIIHPRLCRAGDLSFHEPLDFALAFWMVHETAEPSTLFKQLYGALKPSGILLFTEPVFHVSSSDFRREVAAARKAGFTLIGEPRIRWCFSAVLAKEEENISRLL